ncbi:peptide-methionine (S)-S-oxide reductase MsrA [Robiginitomaculum antarcticum]|uniref:peptide-methionine (S)-S-oxide reductase MsrA n=1 Tax=Robiginitomaculum antarcticum TaxID=437507 RepID=UPI00036D6D99|nr:peptide-methionine (S)-S-oxide reductase MsrA [Robiginitomaculum antarcticum]
MKIENQLCDNQDHFISGRNMFGDYPEGMEQAVFGMGCFWGVERIFWQLPGVYATSVGYAGGTDDAPTYKSVCGGRTGHAEVVHVVYDPAVISYADLLKVMFENHNPTQGDRQGNDRGSQYRSVIFTFDDGQRMAAEEAVTRYGAAYHDKGFGAITTQILPAQTYYAAEDYHQQYLQKNPAGYCNHGPTGVVCPMPTRVTA